MGTVSIENSFNYMKELKGFTSGYGSPNNNLNNNKNTKKLCCLALLSAMVTILSFISIPLGTMKISIEGFPVYIAGLVFGPMGGVITGTIGGLIYQFFCYGITPTTPLWVIAHIFVGYTAGILTMGEKDFFKMVRKSKKNKILFASCIVLMNLGATLFNTFAIKADAIMFGYYTETLITATIWYRLFLSFVKGIIYSIVLPSICDRVLKEINK